MSNSDSTHFSDPKTYKILCIPSYGLEDMNLARFKYLQEFLGEKKTEKLKLGRTLLASETKGRAGRETAANNLGRGPSSAGSGKKRIGD
jgi:hypothetical protein